MARLPFFFIFEVMVYSFSILHHHTVHFVGGVLPKFQDFFWQ